MARTSIRFWFCIAVAMLAASFANPLIEFASNVGVFGDRDYTDHSNVDFLPTLFIGMLFLSVHVSLRIHRAFTRTHESTHDRLRSWSGALERETLARLIPRTFAAQISILYLMETAEQYAVTGHALGGTIWLGGPALPSLLLHAAFCLMTTFCVGRCVRTLARTALHIVHFIRALAMLSIHGDRETFVHHLDIPAHLSRLLVRCPIGERAPPLLSV